MKVMAIDHVSPKVQIELDIGFLKWLQLKLSDFVFLKYDSEPGWTGSAAFFIVKCKDCGCYFLDNKHGHREYFSCPMCGRL